MIEYATTSGTPDLGARRSLARWIEGEYRFARLEALKRGDKIDPKVLEREHTATKRLVAAGDFAAAAAACATIKRLLRYRAARQDFEHRRALGRVGTQTG